MVCFVGVDALHPIRHASISLMKEGLAMRRPDLIQVLDTQIISWEPETRGEMKLKQGHSIDE